MKVRFLLLASLVFAGSNAPARAADDQPPVLRGVIEKALDQKTNLAVTKKPILEALELISQHTTVRLVMSRRTQEILPYGPSTIVTATIRDVTLRQGLEGMLRPIGMTLVVGNEHVEVVPTPPLRRLGRRPSRDELALVEKLNKSEWAHSLAASLPFQFQVQDVAGPKQALLTQAAGVGAGSATQVLDLATRALGWTWFPSSKQIVILTRQQQTLRQLERPVSVHYVKQPVGKVIADLAGQADVTPSFEPGVLALLSPQAREQFSLLAEGVTVREALNQIAGATGLMYAIEAEGIHVHASPGLRDAPTPHDPIVAKIVMPLGSDGAHIEIPIRASECEPALKAYIDAKKKQHLDKLTEQLGP